jgi:hypothetical protein
MVRAIDKPMPMPSRFVVKNGSNTSFKVVNGNAGAGMRSFLEFAAPRLRKSLESDEAKLSAKLPRPLARSPRGVTKDKPKKEKAVA